MQVLVIAAATGDSGEATRLRPGDRAAIHRGVQLAGAACQIRVPAGDRAAQIYAAATRGACETWDDRSYPPADLALIGPGAIETFGDELAGRLVDRLSATLWFEVLSFEPRGEFCRIVCDAGHGARHVVQVTGPAVLVLSDQVERPPYVSHFRLARASRLIPKAWVTAGMGQSWQPVSPRPPRAVRSLDTTAEDRTNSAFGIATGSSSSNLRQVIAETPQVCAQMLLRYLVQYGFVTRNRLLSVPLPETAQENQHAASQPLQNTFTLGPLPAHQRGPRHSADSEQRLRRRPRPLIVHVAIPRSVPHAALQRGPRRLVDETPPGRRGPFRLMTPTT